MITESMKEDIIIKEKIEMITHSLEQNKSLTAENETLMTTERNQQCKLLDVTQKLNSQEITITLSTKK